MIVSAAERTLRNPRRWLCLVVVIAVLVRLFQLQIRSLWFDEAWSWASTLKAGPAELIELARDDFHPPFYFLVLHFWTLLFGDSIIAMRLLSVVFGTLAVIGSYFFARDACRFGSDREGTDKQNLAVWAGLGAALMMTFSTTHIVWSQQVRMYSMGTCFAIFSGWFLLGTLYLGSFRWALAYVLVTSLLLHTHNFGLLTMAAQTCFVVGWVLARWFRHRRKNQRQSSSDRTALFALVATAVLYLPWFFAGLMNQLTRVREDFWIKEMKWQSVSGVVRTLFAPVVDSGPMTDLAAILWLDVLALVIVIGVFVGTPGTRFALCMGAGPMLIASLASLFVTPLMMPRYFQFAHAALLVAIIGSVSQIQRPAFRRMLFVTLVLGSLGWHVRTTNAMAIENRRGVSGLMRYISSHNDDLPVVVHRSTLLHACRYYLNGSGGVYVLPGNETKPYDGGSIIESLDAVNFGRLDDSLGFWLIGYAEIDAPGMPTLDLGPGWRYDEASFAHEECDRLRSHYGYKASCVCIRVVKAESKLKQEDSVIGFPRSSE